MRSWPPPRRPLPSCCASSRMTFCMGRSPPTPASRRSTRRSGGTAIRGPSGIEIFDAAKRRPAASVRPRIFAHLAADSVAHNYFVPKQLAVTSSTSALGHSYWESRFETHLGSECARRARELILIDHSRSDGLLDRVLSPTIFSTPTNRRIFRGMVIVADNESWQRIFQLMTENSRWDLADGDVGDYIARSYDFMIDLLRRMDRAEPFQPRPVGRRSAADGEAGASKSAAREGEHRLHEEAERHFGMPATSLRLRAPTSRRRSTLRVRAASN